MTAPERAAQPTAALTEAELDAQAVAAVLSAHTLRSWSCTCMAWTFQPRTVNYGGHDLLAGHDLHVAQALAAAERLAQRTDGPTAPEPTDGEVVLTPEQIRTLEW